jgi:hypothetical protein
MSGLGGKWVVGQRLSERLYEPGRLLALAVIGTIAGVALIAVFPAATPGARAMISLGHVGGLLYAMAFWAERCGRLPRARSGLILIGLVTVPAVASGIARVPYGGLLYSGGFLIGATTVMWVGERLYRFVLTQTRALGRE